MKSNRLLNRLRNLHGSGALAAVQLPGGHSQLCQHGAICWLKARRLIPGLAGALLATACLSPSLHAGIIYSPNPVNAGIYPSGGTLSLPIQVSSTLTGPDTYWLSAGFNLSWDSSVVTFQSISLNGTPILALTPSDFHSPSAGQLNFNWYSADGVTGYQVADGSTLFTVNFQSVGDMGNYGNSTTLTFSGGATIYLTDVTGHDLTSETPTFNLNATITIIPEPVTVALGVFAGVSVVAILARTRRVRDQIRRWRAAAVRWADAV